MHDSYTLGYYYKINTMCLLKTISLNRTLDTNFVLCDCFTCLQNDVEIPIPHYFVCERAKALKEREKLLGQILAKLGPQDTGQVSCICEQHFCSLVEITVFR